MNSKYWYDKQKVPDSIKKYLSDTCIGREVGMLPNGVKLLKVDDVVFKNCFDVNRIYLYRGSFTAPSYENDYINATNYLTEDGLAGFSISDSGWISSLFSNEEWHGFTEMIIPYVNNANKLVCIGSEKELHLINLYKHILNFNVVATTINDNDLMRIHHGDDFMDNFIKNYGYIYHIFMIRNHVNEINRFNDYFVAHDFVDSLVFPNNP